MPKSFKRVWDPKRKETKACPDCGNVVVVRSRNFRPPERDDRDGWATALRLYRAGYRYTSFHDERGRRLRVRVPRALKEADEFIATRLKRRRH
jgi:hypothetical protein